jgi:hypothetical protein
VWGISPISHLFQSFATKIADFFAANAARAAGPYGAAPPARAAGPYGWYSIGGANGTSPAQINALAQQMSPTTTKTENIPSQPQQRVDKAHQLRLWRRGFSGSTNLQ